MGSLGLMVSDPPHGVPGTSRSRLWDAPAAPFQKAFGAPVLCCRLDTLPCEPHALAEMVLSPDERETWLRMRAVEKRRQEWLLGRCAAKDAVRLLVEEYTGVHLVPAEVGIVPDSYGLPQVAGAWTGRLGIQPLVSIAHSHGTAVALAALHSGIRVGIDLENLAARREDFEAIAFRPDEREMLAALPGELRQEWALRMWCAKEAVAKALGRGFRPGIQTFHITGAETPSGIVHLELCDQALEEFPCWQGISIKIYTGREKNFVFSTTIFGGAVE